LPHHNPVLKIKFTFQVTLPKHSVIRIAFLSKQILRSVVSKVIFLSHPEVDIDPSIPVPQWRLSEKGRARMVRFCHRRGILRSVSSVFTSDEQKATDCGQIAREILSIPHFVNALLGEIDRSVTGFLPPAEHNAVSREAFERPDESIRGWEPAVAAQRRIVLGLEQVSDDPRRPAGDTLIVSHGGVGLLLLCNLLSEPISRQRVMQNAGGGCFYTVDCSARKVLTLWSDMDSD
jgi:broad specificity phosphatase PhoE